MFHTNHDGRFSAGYVNSRDQVNMGFAFKSKPKDDGAELNVYHMACRHCNHRYHRPAAGVASSGCPKCQKSQIKGNAVKSYKGTVTPPVLTSPYPQDNKTPDPKKDGLTTDSIIWKPGDRDIVASQVRQMIMRKDGRIKCTSWDQCDGNAKDFWRGIVDHVVGFYQKTLNKRPTQHNFLDSL